MKKEKYTLEYPLKNASESILWKLIGTEIGLSEWFADDVSIEDKKCTFIWDGYEEIAFIQKIKEKELIRFQWEDDMDTDAYFQFEISQNEMLGKWTLFITDFSEPDEKEDDILMWDKQIKTLFRLIGL